MDKAEAMLAKVRAGAKVQLLGYPPFDGQTKEAHVIGRKGKVIHLRCSHGPVLRMHCKGPLAGLIR